MPTPKSLSENRQLPCHPKRWTLLSFFIVPIRSTTSFFAAVLIAGLFTVACEDSTLVGPTVVTRTDAAAVGGAPYSAKASGGKATGGAKGLTQGIEVQFDFNAHEKGPRGRDAA